MPTLPGLTITAPPAADEGGEFTFVVDRTINTATACSVRWRQGGTITPNDFAVGTPLSGLLEFAPGQSQGFIRFLVSDDADIEPDETLTVELGEPVGCVLLQQPAGGRVEVNDDGTIKYTPLSGFTGTDVIPYMARNSDGQLASSQITVVVDPPTAPHFVNNYRVKIEAWVAPDTEAMTGFELLFDITDPQLRTEQNQGVVRDPNGRDIRLEDGAGNVVPYARLRYNPMSGRIVGIAKRDRATPTTWNNLEIYGGKVGTIVEEAQPGVALASLLACWRLDTGVDLTSNGRNLTLTSTAINTTPPTTVFEEPAGNFDRTLGHQASLPDPSGWLNGLTAFSLMMDLVVDTVAADSGVFRTGGTDAATIDQNTTMGVRPDKLSFFATPAVTNLWFSIVKISATLCQVESGTNTLKIGPPTTFSMAWASGQAITHVVDDAVLIPAFSAVAAPAGTLTVPGGPLVIAGGPRGNFDGKIGLVRIAGTRRTNAWLKAEQRNRLYPHELLSWGEAVGPNDTAAPVAFFDTATATGPDKSIPMPSLNTGTGIKFVAATAEFATSVTIVNTPTVGASLLYKQRPSSPAFDRVTYTIEDSRGRRSTSIIRVAVSGTPLVVEYDGTYETTGVTPISIPVQANDQGVGRHIISIDNVLPDHATAVVAGSGDTATITYTPIKPFYGPDQFFYTVADSAGQTAQGKVDTLVHRPAIAAAAIVAAAITAGDTAGRLISPLTDLNTVGVDLTLPSQTFVMTPAQGSAALSGTTQIKYMPPATIGTATDVSFSYKIRDAYAQETTGTIKITVNPVAPVVVSAGDDLTYTATSAQTVFQLPTSPLANDTLNNVANAAALTIQSFTPASGVGSGGGTFARVTGNKQVNYTAPTVTAVTTDEIDYTITDSATPTAHTDVGKIRVTVSPPSDNTRPENPTPLSSIPDSRIRNVGFTVTGQKSYPTGNAGLKSAYTDAVAGDHIVLANGNYGDFTFSKNIATATPIVIRAQNRNGAVFNIITYTGVSHWLHELKVTFDQLSGTEGAGGCFNVESPGNWLKVTRCWLTGRNGITMHRLAHHIWIGWSRFTGRAGVQSGPRTAGCTHIYLNLPTGHGTWQTLNQGPHDIFIYRNFIFDRTSRSDLGPNGAGPHEDHYVYFGTAKVYDNIGWIPEGYVEYNLIYDDGSAGSSRARGIYLKRGCIMRYNDIDLPQGAGSNGFRHSEGGEIYGNRIRDAGDDLNVNGGRNGQDQFGRDRFAKVHSNALACKLSLWAACESSSGNAPHQAADYCKVGPNQKIGSGALVVVAGDHAGNFVPADAPSSANNWLSGGALDHVSINHGSFAAYAVQRQGSPWVDTDTVPNVSSSGLGGFTLVTPITLTPSDVGQKELGTAQKVQT